MRSIGAPNMLLITCITIFFTSTNDDLLSQENEPLFYDGFEDGSLDTAKWEAVSDGDFEHKVIDVFDVDSSETTDYRLRLSASTIGTSDPMKYLGVRCRTVIDFRSAKTITFAIDWNDQQNGSYLSAAVYLCPTICDNPKKEANWQAFEYTGVPPGRNLRTNIWAQTGNFLRVQYEDWGPRDSKGRPTGRPIGNMSHTICITLDEKHITVSEDGEVIYPQSMHYQNFTTAYIYLQMSSGTNYPNRVIYFDDVVVMEKSLSEQHTSE